MRYIYYIITILLVLSVVIGYELHEKREPVKDAALIINDRIISTDEFNMLYSSRHPHLQKKSDFINSLITKELLIQESKKEGIDKEESFRSSIQNFYEQSLIKLLMDRKFATLNITVSDDELNKYIAFLDKKIYLTIFSFDNSEEAKRDDYRDGESKIVYFKDLSIGIRESIMQLREGEMTEPVKSGEKYVVVRLDKTEIFSYLMPSDSERERIKKILIDGKKEKIINDWVADLREKASIKFFSGEKN